MSRRRQIGKQSRCVDGRIMRHDPQPDDPYLETDIGMCEVCEGLGCVTCKRCGETVALGSEPDGCRDFNCPMVLT